MNDMKEQIQEAIDEFYEGSPDQIADAVMAVLREQEPVAWMYHAKEFHKQTTFAAIAFTGQYGVEVLSKDPLYALPVPPAGSFQSRVQPWMSACFGAEISANRTERNHRFLEEALELVQACGCTQAEAHQLVDYVFGRPVGEPAQEVGGVMVTLAALCLANGMDMHNAADTELARIWTKVEQIRAKQAAKPKHSPLPVPPAAVEDYAPAGVIEALQRLIENGATLGPASRDDAMLVAQHRTQLLAAPATPAEHAISTAAVAVPEGWALVPTEILGRFPEINHSNYGHDDVCELNAWGVELVLAAAPKPGGE